MSSRGHRLQRASGYIFVNSQVFSTQTFPRCQRQLGIRKATIGVGSA
jgi:hypothetical protein